MELKPIWLTLSPRLSLLGVLLPLKALSQYAQGLFFPLNGGDEEEGNMESFFMIMGAGGTQGVVHELPCPPTTHPKGA